MVVPIAMLSSPSEIRLCHAGSDSSVLTMITDQKNPTVAAELTNRSAVADQSLVGRVGTIVIGTARAGLLVMEA